jgi:luciferase-type oxidoreductase
MPSYLTQHHAYRRIFQPGRLTFGFIAPLEGYPASPCPTLVDHAAIVRKADRLGFPVIWLRDVPFYDPSFGDVGQVMDPMVYGGWLAGQTCNIAIGTAGIVLPLRDPIIVAKQAASIDQLSGGRFLLGLSTGDRPVEYPAFGQPFENRADRFRDALDVIRVTTEQDFGEFHSEHYGRLDGSINLVPKPTGARLPIIAIGRAGQELGWLAANTDGWVWHLSDFARLPAVIAKWREACGEHGFKPYGYGTFFYLDADPDAPLQVAAGKGLRTGRNALIELWKRQQDEGVAHVALNLKPLRRPASDVLTELAEHVLPLFSPTRA